MGDDAGDSAHGGPFFRLPQDLLGLQLLGDVSIDFQNERVRLISQCQRPPAGNRHLSSVLGALNEIAFPPSGRGDRFSNYLLRDRKPGGQHLMKLAAGHLATRPTIEGLGAWVPRLHDAAVVAHDDGFGSELQELSTLAQPLFHHFKVSQIEISSHSASDIYGAIATRAGTDQRGHFFSVGAPKSQNPPKPTAFKRSARSYFF